jgi:hypothetical protein
MLPSRVGPAVPSQAWPGRCSLESTLPSDFSVETLANRRVPLVLRWPIETAAGYVECWTDLIRR